MTSTLETINSVQTFEPIKMQSRDSLAISEPVALKPLANNPGKNFSPTESQEKMNALANRIQEGIQAFSSSVNFKYDDVLKQMIVVVKESGAVVKQIPSEEMVSLMHKMKEAIEGILLDTKG